MMSEFDYLREKMLACRRCIEAGFDVAPGAVFSGPESARVMVIGQAPGITETQVGRPFNAGSGKRLFEWLAMAGWEEAEFRSKQYMTAITKCYPGKDKSGKGDRVPSKKEQFLCRGFLEAEISSVRPRLILPVGRLAISHFFRGFKSLKDILGKTGFISWDQDHLALPLGLEGSWLSEEWEVENPASGSWIVPLPHPSGASLWPNKEENKALIGRAVAAIGKLRSVSDL